MVKKKTNKRNQSKKTCFVISPIGNTDSNTRQRSDQVLNYVIKPAFKKFDYEVIRADTISKAGNITTQIIEHLLEDDLVIADLTENNPNVFYELAIRHSTKKPYIQIKDIETKIPFDISGLRTISFDYRYVNSMKICTSEIINQIEYFDQNLDKLVESPVSTAIDFMNLSKNPKEKQFLKLVSKLEDKINYINDKIDNSQLSTRRSLNDATVYDPAGMYDSNVFDPNIFDTNAYDSSVFSSAPSGLNKKCKNCGLVYNIITTVDDVCKNCGLKL